MKPYPPGNVVVRGLLLLVPALALAPLSSDAQPTIWDGPMITYEQPGNDPTDPANQDRITDAVWLTRGPIEGLFNANTEPSFLRASSPGDTEWAYGDLENYDTLEFSTWNTLHMTNAPSIEGQNAVLHLISEDIYLAIRVTFWASGDRSAGSLPGFSYERSTAPVPEPSSAALLLLGLGACLGTRRLRQRTATGA